MDLTSINRLRAWYCRIDRSFVDNIRQYIFMKTTSRILIIFKKAETILFLKNILCRVNPCFKRSLSISITNNSWSIANKDQPTLANIPSANSLFISVNGRSGYCTSIKGQTNARSKVCSFPRSLHRIEHLLFTHYYPLSISRSAIKRFRGSTRQRFFSGSLEPIPETRMCEDVSTSEVSHRADERNDQSLAS